MSEQPPNPPYGQGNPGEQGGYGYQAPGPYGAAPDHPQATTVMVLGVVSLVVCQILGPVAWVMGNRVIREIDASGGRIGGRSSANAGRICGIIGSVLLILALVALVGVAVLVAIFAVAGPATTSP